MGRTALIELWRIPAEVNSDIYRLKFGEFDLDEDIGSFHAHLQNLVAELKAEEDSKAN